MKQVGTLLILLFAIAKAQTPEPPQLGFSLLAVQYVGNTDKPVFPIIFSDSRAGAESYRTSMLNRTEMMLAVVHAIDAAVMVKLINEAE